MPCLKIFTNIPKYAIPINFVQKIVPVLSKCVKKPEEKFLVAISADCILSVGGGNEPSVIASLESIGHLGPKENQLISKDITECISAELGVAKNRVFITFYDLLHSNVAINGATREGYD